MAAAGLIRSPEVHALDCILCWRNEGQGKKLPACLLEAQDVGQRKQSLKVQRMLLSHFLGIFLTGIISPHFPLWFPSVLRPSLPASPPSSASSTLLNGPGARLHTFFWAMRSYAGSS